MIYRHCARFFSNKFEGLRKERNFMKRNSIVAILFMAVFLLGGITVNAQQNVINFPCSTIPQYFSVPPGVTSINVEMAGAAGIAGARMVTGLRAAARAAPRRFSSAANIRAAMAAARAASVMAAPCWSWPRAAAAAEVSGFFCAPLSVVMAALPTILVLSI
jgi:hypothetical protein